MARPTKTDPIPADFDEHIVDIDVRDEMRSSYLEYAYSVIYARALPDARDGLKPCSAASSTRWTIWACAPTVGTSRARASSGR